jgi:hypothetical protein
VNGHNAEKLAALIFGDEDRRARPGVEPLDAPRYFSRIVWVPELVKETADR